MAAQVDAGHHAGMPYSGQIAAALMTLDRYGHLWPDELEDLAERLDRARATAVAPYWRPAVVQLCKGQVIDLALWWRWGDSNSTSPIPSVPGHGAVGERPALSMSV